MCWAGAPTGGKSSSLVWTKPDHARSSIPETIWVFSCLLSYCLYLNITPRVHSTPKPQQKPRGSNITFFKQLERSAASLFLIWWVAVLSVLTEVIERQFGVNATAKCILLFCSVRYFVQLKAVPNGGKSLIVYFCAGFYHRNQGKLTCDQSLSQDKDHYREKHFPQTADP